MHSQGLNDDALRAAWGVETAGRRGPRPRFTVSDVVEASVARADRGGLSTVSMAAIANDLQLTATALYRYVDSKETLVELMVDRAVGEPPTLPEGGWHDRVSAWARALWHRYLEHPWLTDVRLSGMPRHPHRIAWIEQALLELDEGGIEDPMRVTLLLDGIARMFALLAGFAPTSESPPPWLADLIAARYPRMSSEMARDWADITDEFESAVETALLGAQRLPRRST